MRIESSFRHLKLISFKYFNVEDVKIPVNSNIIEPALTDCYNQNIKNSTFLNELKNADISPVYKKDDRLDKSNYRPVSILVLSSKLFELNLYEQTDSHTKDMLLK